ncbi:acetyl-CoA C-acyltransferase [Rhodococcus qingshengii]|jgi:acetyl-CoA C-acetyltransferase|uniref:acetyl-CoA C-acyltransferase n=1 Tax=Rhodococcus qingshengii TaxID=334542 RepID=UPI0005A6ED36|nr:acetyl-CoA C-acyltransferase [Rhodococcus qingshengii]MDJ0490678.1 acetyl-CoA C-acyltransferase [Rhodococcus qingshengii]
MPHAVIVAGARTPIGKLGGTLATISATDLGAHAISHALSRAKVHASDVDAVVMGNVVQAGVGPNPARQAAVSAGIPMSVPAVTINNLCLSGLQAIIDADRMIRSGDAEVVVAGGMESMSNAPYLARGARSGFRFGRADFEDALEHDALLCAFDRIPMGEATERYLDSATVSRLELDTFSARSHAYAAEASVNGTFASEIAPIDTKGRHGTVTLEHDEGIRPETTVAKLGTLKPAFTNDGIITAGSSSQLSDGACAVIVMAKSTAVQRGLEWIAEIGGTALVAGPDTSLLHQPAAAITQAVKLDGRTTVDMLDLVEINEAFAGVALASMADLGVDEQRVNIHGGAIALGHPVGMSGARIALSLANSLKQHGRGTGAAALCGGGGQGNAIILHRE